MKIFKELIIIIGIFLAGEFIAGYLSVPFFGSVLGMFALVLLMFFKVFKESDLEQLTSFFDDNMSFFFIPPAIEIIKIFDIVRDNLWQILVIIFVTTILTFLVTYFSAALLMKLFYKDEDEKEGENNGSMA